MRLAAFVGMCVALASTSALGAHWVMTSSDRDGDKVFYDTESSAHQDNRVSAWIKIRFAKPRPDGTTHMLTYITFDCTARTSEVHDYEMLNVSGNVLDKGHRESAEVEPIPPESFIESAYKPLCAPPRATH
jgi:hypothetical protein